MKDDLSIWIEFLTSFNGRTVCQEEFVECNALGLFTDASGALGYGAFFQGQCSAEPWYKSWRLQGVTKKVVLLELFLVVVALCIWGSYFRDRRIILHTDNKGVHFALKYLSSNCDKVVRLLHFIVLACFRLNVWLKSKYIPMKCNDLADSVSRAQWDRF